MSVHSAIAAASASMAVVMLTTAGVRAQQAPTFSSSTRLVTVAVSVMKGGQPVTGLTQADFEVRSDDQVRPIVQFTSEPGPVTAALLLDASGSMNVNGAMAPAEVGAHEFLTELAPGSDRAAVFTFDDALQMRHDFSPVGPAQRQSLVGTRAFGSTSLYDAVLATSRALAADGAPRRAVVVLTDGIDTSSSHTPMDVQTFVAAIDVPVYVLTISPAVTPTLDAIAQGTGGQAFPVAPGHTMARARAAIVSSLRQHYLLAFEPDARPGWHSLTVRTRSNHTVRARAGYSVSPRT